MFQRVSSLGGDVQPFEWYLLTDGEGATRGEALVQTNGRLTKCGATATPEFIAERTQAAEATSVTPLPVTRITEGDDFTTTSTATVASSLVGSKVTLGADGLTVTATTTSGVFEVSSTDGVTGGGVVHGYFRR
ncbi:MAG: hypothetical protein Q8911_00495 [Bacillota bacterium]|nr:hypothetical protein [Bacillota bacterium]